METDSMSPVFCSPSHSKSHVWKILSQKPAVWLLILFYVSAVELLNIKFLKLSSRQQRNVDHSQHSSDHII